MPFIESDIYIVNGNGTENESNYIIQSDHKECNLNKNAKINKRDLWSNHIVPYKPYIQMYIVYTIDGMQIFMWKQIWKKKSL